MIAKGVRRREKEQDNIRQFLVENLKMGPAVAYTRIEILRPLCSGLICASADERKPHCCGARWGGMNSGKSAPMLDPLKPVHSYCQYKSEYKTNNASLTLVLAFDLNGRGPAILKNMIDTVFRS